MLAELDTLYRLGHRGHVDFVDDNLIGNQEGAQALPAGTERLARRSAATRSGSPPKPR